MFTEDQITEIVTTQLDSLIWSEGELVNELGEFAGELWEDFYSAEDATPELIAQLTEELGELSVYDADFTAEFAHAVKAYVKHFGDTWPGQFGHDLALTRNQHGAGFWDRGLGGAGDVLTAWAGSLGTLHVFHGHESIHPDKWAGKFHAE